MIFKSSSRNKLFSYRPNFYTLYFCRNICVQTNQIRFAINQIQEILKSYDLNFLGSLLPLHIKTLYKYYFSENREKPIYKLSKI